MQNLEDYVTQALKGNKNALEEVVKGVQDMVYNLALKMLWHPEDAQDVTQEILIKLVTHLAKFEGRSKFTTWAYRVAANEILNYKARHFSKQLQFTDFEAQLATGLASGVGYTENEAEQRLLVQEAKVGCSTAMLQCLDRPSRLAYILGEILELNSKEAAEIMEVSPEAFRKRLSRTRAVISQFVQRNCGLVNPQNACLCHRKVDAGIANGRINPDQLLFAFDKPGQLIDAIDRVEDEVALFRSNPEYEAPGQLLQEVKRIVRTSVF